MFNLACMCVFKSAQVGARAHAHAMMTHTFFYYDLMTRASIICHTMAGSALTPSRKWMAIVEREREAWGGAVMVVNIVYVHVII